MLILNILVAFLAVIFIFSAFALCLDVVWRTKNHLTVVFKFYALAFGLLLAREVLFVLSAGKSGDWNVVFLGLEVFLGLFFMLGTWKMYQIVRNLDNENSSN
jgi:hypothetical protein